MANWRLENNCIFLSYQNNDFFWKMPDGYSLPSEEVLSLVEFLLFSPYGIKVDVIKKNTIKQHRTALAFSGGVDSAAAYNLLEEPVAIYTQVASPSKLHKQENALLALKEVNGISVLTNQDELPELFGKKKGFYGLAGWTVPSILLSEHFGFNTFSDGNILEFVYLRSKHGHGTLYNEPDYSAVHEAFAKLNYHYCMPCAGLTEIVTTYIAKDFKYAMGCMRGESGKPCLNCMKCYRKMAIQGNCISTNPEAEKILSKEWIPVLASLLWARDNKGLSHPVLNELDKDYRWVENWYEKSLEFIPLHIRGDFLNKLQSYHVLKLEDVRSLQVWSSSVHD
ncbi:DUF6395 domain-containing protein [Vreelandella zhanjiangensis]|uniref:DUF6395 domain-containing protein n=1 Tax=Vreelandella zhanjiangensis TaxID=1121960 RepID=UPI00035E433E|nr:DUF6395 domain-containing protein [Halomonas zhanjiangensis]